MKRKYKIFLALFVTCLALTLGKSNHPITFAQTNSNGWFEPVNISQSGESFAPAFFIDIDENFHIIWQDEYYGFVYAYGNGQEWSEPEYFEFPFRLSDEAKLFFIADQNSKLHTFWIEADGNLFYSQTSIENITNSVQWTPTQLLGRAVVGLSAEVDDNNNLHLAYLRGQATTETTPAGIYYRQFLAGSSNWSDPIAIIQSPYFRSLTTEEANLEIATATHLDETTLYVVWDFTPKRQTILARSVDGGSNWESPTQISTAPNFLYTPYDIQIESSGEQAVILWKLGEIGGVCSQQYISTTDGGQTWQEPKTLFNEENGCPTENHLLTTPDGFLLFSLLNEQAYFLLWNGIEWSIPQLQNDFSNLVDPETNLFLNLGCLQTLFYMDTFYAAGCDSLDSPDIWSTGIEIPQTDSWFPNQSLWTKPEAFHQDLLEIGSTQIIADSTGRLHAFWNQRTIDDLIYRGAIYHSVWDQSAWSPANLIIGSSFGNAYLHKVAISSDDVIFLVWEDLSSDGITLSWADANQAQNAAEWVSSGSIPAYRNGATSPDILIRDDEKITVSYVLPLNEERGVYLVNSPDGGNSWSSISQIADGSLMNWAMVNYPKITENTGHWEAIWSHLTLPPNEIPTGLYAANSEDGGSTWSAPEKLFDGFITWHHIDFTQDDIFHRVWQENDRENQYLWHQYSTDMGSSWHSPKNILTTNASIEAITTVNNSFKQLHLIAIIKDISDNTTLQHWIWENESWTVSEGQNLGKNINILPGSLSAALAQDGTLGIIYGSQKVDKAIEMINYQIDFSKRFIKVTDNVVAKDPSPTQSITLTPTPTQNLPTPTSTLEILPTATQQSLPNEPNSAPATGQWTGLLAGGAIAFVLLIIFIVIGLFIRIRKGQ